MSYCKKGKMGKNLLGLLILSITFMLSSILVLREFAGNLNLLKWQNVPKRGKGTARVLYSNRSSSFLGTS